MANPDRQTKPSTELSEQEVLNWSFDRLYRVLTVHLAKYDPETNQMVRDTDAGASDHDENQVSVTNTATEIVSARANRRAVVIINSGEKDVFLGKSNVTASTGLLLLGVKGGAITIDTSAAVYGITASGSQTVSYMEIF